MDEDFLITRASTIHGNELDNENNIIGMESEEKKKEMSKTEIDEMNKIFNNFKSSLIKENEKKNENNQNYIKKNLSLKI